MTPLQKKPRSLVTGGAGFLGSHLCDYLIAKGHTVICMDNLITGNKNNIKHLFDNENFEFIKYDVSNQIDVDGKIDYIWHFASPASPIDYQQIPIETLKVGSYGTYNALRLAKEKDARFLLASTSECYGDPLIHPQPEDYWGNVNPVGPRGCFPPDTDILTDDGWKSFTKITKKSKVATLNKNGEIEFHNPNEIIKYNYTGDMLVFKNRKMDIKVTPNHKMYVCKKHKKDFELVEAQENIFWKGAQAKTNAKWKAKRKEYFILPKTALSKVKIDDKIKMDVWLEFLGYFLSEGCTYLRSRTQLIKGKSYKTKVYTILIAQDRKNKEERNKIERCLKKMPFTYHSSDDHQFRITNKQLYTYLVRLGKSKEKYIPKDFKELPPEQLKILFRALILGDGNKKGSKYYSNSKRLIDDFQEITLKLGMSVAVHIAKRENGRILYCANIRNYDKSKSSKDFLTPKYPSPKKEKYSGNVYCVNVKNHIIYVRRKGYALWCGNCYDEAKRFAEAMTMAFHRVHKIKTRIVRIFNTYGPRMRAHDGRVVPAFINQAINNEPITIFGDGKQTRSFCYVADLIDGIHKLMMSDEIYPTNIGNPHEMTILEFAKKIIDITGSKSKLSFKDLPVDDPKTRQPDITKAKKLLDWEPKIQFDEGIKKVIEYFNENKD